MRALAVGLLGLACSSCADLCTQAQHTEANFQRRHSTCFADGSLPTPAFDPSKCDAAMRGCTKAEAAAVQQYLDCIDALPTCSVETRSTFNTDVLACTDALGQAGMHCFGQ